jgi:serine/threonine protein kinase
MSHPLIVKLNYAFQTKNKLVMVMDYCPKGDLCKYYIILLNEKVNYLDIIKRFQKLLLVFT